MSCSRSKLRRCTEIISRNTAFVFLLAVAASCSEHRPVVARYYDMDSLLDRQIAMLVEQKAVLEKNAVIGKENSRVVLVPPDSAGWAEELDIFRNLGVINKPINRGAYKDTIRRDKTSNLTIRSFISVDEDLPIQELNLFFLNNPRDIRKIEAVYREANMMYETKRLLRMDFRKRSAGSVVSAYSVIGGQKMLLGDTVEYAVKAKISIPQN